MADLETTLLLPSHSNQFIASSMRYRCWKSSLMPFGAIKVPTIKSPLPGYEVLGKAVKVQRRIGLSGGVAMIVGQIIGSGIFVSPVGVFQYTGSVGMSLVVWGLTGLLSLLGALCYIELGLTFPTSGNDFTYLQRICGNLPAFLHLWLHVLVLIPCNYAIASMTFASYILKPFFSTCPIPRSCIRMVAALCLSLLTYINHRSVDWTVRIQKIFTVSKVNTLIVIIVAGVVHLCQGNTENFENPFQGSTVHPLYIVLAVYSSMYSYFGWSILNDIVEEIKDPIRNLPRSIFISLPIVIVVYILSNAAYFAVLSPNEILTSEALAVSFGERALSFMSWIMPLCIACSTIGGLNSEVYASSRLLYVGAREDLLPSWLSLVNINYYSPTPSLVFCCLLSFVFLVTTEVLVLIKYTSFIGSIFSLVSVCGLVFMRFKHPDMERPIKINILVPLIYITLLLTLISVTIYLEFLETIIGIALTVTGIPIYFATVRWQNKPNFYKSISGRFTLFVQKLLLCVPEEKKDI